MYSISVYLIAGWSGFFVMAVELLSGRLLSPYFGSSIYVWGAIITVFMLALSIGYLIGGRMSLDRPRLRVLAAILVLAALATGPILLFGDAIMEWLFDGIQDPRYGSLAASTLLFFVPTVISGMVSPYSVRLLTRHHQESGRNAGTLYFVSTLGSAAGTILTSFYLVLWFELNHILLGAIGISLLIGVFVLWKATNDEAE